jgi:hypothetical protein
MAGAGRHQEGPIFRAIDRWEAVEEKALTPQSINLIEAALRRGGVGPGGVFGAWFAGRYRAEAAKQRMGLRCSSPSIASVQGATSYYNEAERAQGGKVGAQRKLSADNFLPPLAADNRRVEG